MPAVPDKPSGRGGLLFVRVPYAPEGEIRPVNYGELLRMYD